MKRDGTFSVQILGDKDIIIQLTPDVDNFERVNEGNTTSIQSLCAATRNEGLVQGLA